MDLMITDCQLALGSGLEHVDTEACPCWVEQTIVLA